MQPVKALAHVAGRQAKINADGNRRNCHPERGLCSAEWGKGTQTPSPCPNGGQEHVTLDLRVEKRLLYSVLSGSRHSLGKEPSSYTGLVEGFLAAFPEVPSPQLS
jgi:hypothetical protein